MSSPSTIKPTMSLTRETNPLAEYGRQEVIVEGEKILAPLLDRRTLPSGSEIVGPAIITEMDSTTLVLPGSQANVDDYGNILITLIED